MQLARLKEILVKIPAIHVAVLGDFFLDKYLETDPKLVEPSVETGLPAHQVVSQRSSAGAAGTVVNNLAALGVNKLTAIGAIGSDGEAFELKRCLNRLGCHTEHLLEVPEMMTPTYLKPVDITKPGLEGEHSRYDTKNRRPTSAEVTERVLAGAAKVLPTVDALVILDQVEDELCETITPRVRDWLAENAPRFPHVKFFADSRFHIRKFRNVIIKPNQFEVVGRGTPLPGETVELARIKDELPKLRSQVAAPVFVTLGPRGMLVSDPQPIHVTGFPVTGPIDTTGAGDSATAGAVCALCAGATYSEAAFVANIVASITIQQLGTTGTASPAQVERRYQEWCGQGLPPLA